MLYSLLQTAVLMVCWGWFAALWSVSVSTYSLADPGAWFLLAAAAAGVFGLRPNLERAIDAVWLRGYRAQPKALAERAAQLRPIKRRIDVIFSLAVVVLAIGFLIWLNLQSAGA